MASSQISLDWETFLESEFPLFYNQQDACLKMLQKKFDKQEEKKLKFLHRDPAILFKHELLQSRTPEQTESRQGTRPWSRDPQVSFSFKDLMRTELEFMSDLPIGEWENAQLFPPYGIFFSLLTLSRNFEYPVHISKHYPQISPRFFAEKHFPAGSLFCFSPNAPFPDLHLQRLIKISREDRVGFYIVLPYCPTHHFFKICEQQLFPVYCLTPPLCFYVNNPPTAIVSCNEPMCLVFLGMQGASFSLTHHIAGYFTLDKKIVFPEPPLDFHTAPSFEITDLCDEIARTVSQIKIRHDEISQNSFRIPFTQKGILAMNQLLNSHVPFSFCGTLPEIFTWRNSKFNKSYHSHEKITLMAFERWRGKLGQKFSFSDASQRCGLCHMKGHSEPQCCTKQLRWEDIDTTDPRDRLMYDTILSYPVFDKFSHPFSPDLPNILLTAVYPEAKIRQQSIRANFVQIFNLAGYDLQLYLTKYNFRATDCHHGIFWMLAFGMEKKYVLFAIFGFPDHSEFSFGPTIFVDPHVSAEDAVIIRESHEKKVREKNYYKCHMIFQSTSFLKPCPAKEEKIELY